jgi:hypothetical protein
MNPHISKTKNMFRGLILKRIWFKNWFPKSNLVLIQLILTTIGTNSSNPPKRVATQHGWKKNTSGEHSSLKTWGQRPDLVLVRFYTIQNLQFEPTKPGNQSNTSFKKK